MKKIAAFCLALLCLCGAAAHAESAAFTTAGEIGAGFPTIDITVRDSGIYRPDDERSHVLTVTIEARDGSFTQEVSYQSNETPDRQVIPAFARLIDMNFDGQNDLVLLTAQGARNVFWTIMLWDPAQQAFCPVYQGAPAWGRNDPPRDWAWTQLELCNFELLPETRQIVSCVEDGYRFRQQIIWGWEGNDGLDVDSVAETYDAGPGLIGETVRLYGTGVRVLWDETYPEDWYYGQAGVAEERLRVMRAVTRGDILYQEAVVLTVANTDWVHLRRQDSKASPSLAKLPAGMQVQLLEAGIGQDEGWVRVLVDAQDAHLGFTPPQEDQPDLTGYVWHSFLTPDVQGLRPVSP